jgi:hypothetical protein
VHAANHAHGQPEHARHPVRLHPAQIGGPYDARNAFMAVTSAGVPPKR